jgi:hypothetical protein
MRRFSSLLKTLCLIGCGGALWMLGAGTCVPYNFYASLLGDTVITGVTGAALSSFLTAIGLGT